MAALNFLGTTKSLAILEVRLRCRGERPAIRETMSGESSDSSLFVGETRLTSDGVDAWRSVEPDFI